VLEKEIISTHLSVVTKPPTTISTTNDNFSSTHHTHTNQPPTNNPITNYNNVRPLLKHPSLVINLLLSRALRKVILLLAGGVFLVHNGDLAEMGKDVLDLAVGMAAVVASQIIEPGNLV